VSDNQPGGQTKNYPHPADASVRRIFYPLDALTVLDWWAKIGNVLRGTLTRVRKSDSFYLVSFFIVLIGVGTLLLLLPGAVASTENGRLKLVDAVFTVTSAVCVTGLSSVAISSFSIFGQIVILCLAQIGALGIISFSSILVAMPGHRFSIGARNTIQGFYLNGLEYHPRRIVRNIVLLTLVIETAGIVSLSLIFQNAGVANPVYAGIFHGVSAFCNAGISLFDDSLALFRHNNLLLAVFGTLILAGSVGFIVLHDIFRVVSARKRKLSYHSLVVVWMTAALSLGGGLFYFILEAKNVYDGMDMGTMLNNAVFQAISARTAGFQTVAQTDFSGPSRLLTGILMFIGGAPGSVSGGLKVTVIFVIAAVMVRRPDSCGDIRVGRRRLSAETINRAVVYFLKAVFLLFACIFALFITRLHADASFEQIVFETVSAFATGGLTLDFTPHLTPAGKTVIIAAMFAGRIGLVALAFPSARHKNYPITYSEGELLI
jgi:trk system potassium uptake protein TrkH